jgi:uncharacterized membrane protein YhaH (DUF805 family)
MTLALISVALSMYDSNNNNPGAGWFIAAFSTFWFIFLILFVFQVYCCWRVAVKSGYQGAYSLLLLIPVVGLIVTLIWVFSEWPIEAELKRCRAQLTAPKVP